MRQRGCGEQGEYTNEVLGINWTVLRVTNQNVYSNTNLSGLLFSTLTAVAAVNAQSQGAYPENQVARVRNPAARTSPPSSNLKRAG